MAAFIGTLSGLLIGPTTTIYYDSGFLIGLKGFVAAVFAGLTSFPLALVGALGVGLIESFGSFWASAFKEVIVFTADPAGAAVAVVRRPRTTRNTEMQPRTHGLLAAFALARGRAAAAARARPSGSRSSTTSACSRWWRWAWCCSPAWAGSPRSARRPSPASAPTPAPTWARRTACRPGSGWWPGWLLTAGGGAAAGLGDAAHVGPLPAAGHHRLEPGAVLHDGQPRRAGQVRRPAGRAADQLFGFSFQDERPHLLADLGRRAGCGAGA